MTGKVRLQIGVEPELRKLLKDEAKRLGISLNSLCNLRLRLKTAVVVQ